MWMSSSPFYLNVVPSVYLHYSWVGSPAGTYAGWAFPTICFFFFCCLSLLGLRKNVTPVDEQLVAILCPSASLSGCFYFLPLPRKWQWRPSNSSMKPCRRSVHMSSIISDVFKWLSPPVWWESHPFHIKYNFMPPTAIPRVWNLLSNLHQMKSPFVFQQ